MSMLYEKCPICQGMLTEGISGGPCPCTRGSTPGWAPTGLTAKQAERLVSERDDAVEARDVAEAAVADLMQESSAFLRGRAEALRQARETIEVLVFPQADPRSGEEVGREAALLALDLIPRNHQSDLPPIQLRQRITALEERVDNLEDVLRALLSGVQQSEANFGDAVRYRGFHAHEVVSRARELLDGETSNV